VTVLERNEEILLRGQEAAKERMQKYPSRADYPHDYMRLYGWLEDKLFNLYDAIALKRYDHIRIMAGEIIITASEIAEYTEFRVGSPAMPERSEEK